LAADHDPAIRPPVAVAGEHVAVTVVKSDGNGSSMLVRLRSFSTKEERVEISWPARTPREVRICDQGEEPGSRDGSGSVIVPPMGLVTLRAAW
jgi:hypothetical protein